MRYPFSKDGTVLLFERSIRMCNMMLSH